MDGPVAASYQAASQYLLSSVGLVPDDRWDTPGLGEWSVRDLVGHANRAHTLVEQYVLHPEPPVERGSSYFSAEAIAERGRQAVAALGQAPAAALARDAERISKLIEASAPETTIGSPMGTMTLAEYLPSRIAELTIHAMDLRRALGSDLEVPPEALRMTLEFVAPMSLRRGGGEAVLLALTGRGDLPAGFSVY